MSWQFFHSLDLSSSWQFTPTCEFDLVRITHETSIQSSKMLIGQAQSTVITELWDVRRTYAKPEVEIFCFEKPEFFDDRRLALRTISNVVTAEIVWKVHLEAWTMPLSRTSSIKPIPSTSAAASTVAANTSSVQLLAANENRRGATLWNASTALLRIDFAAPHANVTFANSPYAVEIGAGDYYELPFNYTGIISGIWSAANGNCLVRELV